MKNINENDNHRLPIPSTPCSLRPISSTTVGAQVSITLSQLQDRTDDMHKKSPGDQCEKIDIDILTNGSNKAVFPQRIPFVLSFNNLSYSVKLPFKFKLVNFHFLKASHSPNNTPPTDQTISTKTKTLLNDISGEAREGEILAVLGASGSGKTTLIDALANRIAKGSLKGTVTLNGQVLESRTLKIISAYVMQDDLLYPMLTVEETLMFSAEFRLPRALSKQKKKERVLALIDQLGLRNSANTVIGDEGHRGISGGERRRVSIGVDIIHDPILLFLDEPTSGLDSTSAFMVVKVLQSIARSGSIVIMTVHQPSYRIMGLLDRLLLLSCGQTIYSGPPVDIPLFFSELGHPVPQNESWVEFALDHIREQQGFAGGTQNLIKFNKAWQNKRQNLNMEALEMRREELNLREAISASISRGKLMISETGNSNLTLMTLPTFANSFWSEMGVLCKRSMTNSWRMPELVFVRFGVVLFTGILLGTIFRNLDESPKGVQDRLGFFGFLLSTTFYTSADALPVFLQERYIFMRETAYNSYRRSSYVISQSLLAIPSLVFLSLGLATTTFWAVGLAGSLSGFAFYCLVILASFWSGNSFVTFVSGIVPNVLLGYVVVIATLAYFILFCGFFISSNRIPPYWIWFNYLSIVKYPFEGVLLNEFQDPTKCFIRGIQIFDNTALGDAPVDMKLRLLANMSITLGRNITSSTCWTTGLEVLQEKGVTELNKWNCLLVTMAWGILFRICFYFSLLGSKNKRK